MPQIAEQRSRRDAIALLDGCEQAPPGIASARSPARDDGRGAALGEELIERQAKASLAAIGSNGRARVVRSHQSSDARGADAFLARPSAARRLAFQASKPADVPPHCAACPLAPRIPASTVKVEKMVASRLPRISPRLLPFHAFRTMKINRAVAAHRWRELF